MLEFNRLISQGEALLEMRRPEQAIEEFQRALALKPDDPTALSYIAYAFILMERYSEALVWSGRAIGADPTNDWPYRIKANAHLGKDQRKSAYKAAATAVSLRPEDVQCLTMLGNCALNLDRREEARMLGELIRKQAPEAVSGHLLLGHLADAEEKFADAAQHFEKALELEPGNANALSALAAIRGRNNRFGESVDLLRGALSVDPTRKDRQSSFSDSMKRLALFGEAYQRRKSVAGLMVAIFSVYLAVCAAARYVLGETRWLSPVVIFGLCLVMLVMIPLLRARFFAAQAQQIQMLQANLARLQRRRTLQATGVAIAAAYGIAAIVYRDTSDPFVFVAPLAIAAAGFWIYMAAITLKLVALWLSDTWSRAMAKEVPEAERGIPLAMKAAPIVAVAALAIGLKTASGFAWFVCLVAMTIAAVMYFQRFPVIVSSVTAILGVMALVADRMSATGGTDGGLDSLGIVLLIGGAAGLAYRGLREIQKAWQRRRLSRLLSGGRTEV